MNSIMNRIAYLNGLMEGMEFDKNTKEGRIIAELVSIVKDMAEEIETVKDSYDELEEYVDAIDEDLSEIEEDLYDEEFDDEECEEDYGNYIDIECPHCDETVYIDSDICESNDKITCPNCHKEIDLDCCKED